jgi:hypothetical protein
LGVPILALRLSYARITKKTARYLWALSVGDYVASDSDCVDGDRSRDAVILPFYLILWIVVTIENLVSSAKMGQYKFTV